MQFAGLWYLFQEGVTSTLIHQKKWNRNSTRTSKLHDRGVQTYQSTKYRSGACSNCGSKSHKSIDCFERPRKRGLKYTNKHFPDSDKIEKLEINHFEAKRDRWNGFDPNDYSSVIDKFEKIELLKRINLGKIDKHEDKIKDEEQLSFDKVERRINTVAGGSTGTIRDLRIREDTAKYLLNLDINSAYYDPKSRSMREDPNALCALENKRYTGDNSIRRSGKEFQEFTELHLQQLCTSREKVDILDNTSPSQSAAMFYINKIINSKSYLPYIFCFLVHTKH
jgi:pre-mRNA-processing factor SLU7